MKSGKRVALGLLSCLFHPTFLLAQVSTGLPPFGSFSGGPDVINLGNLNAHYETPVFFKPGRGIPFAYTLSLDSSIWYPSGGAWTPVQNWGWHGPSDGFRGWVKVSTQTHRCIDPNTGLLVFYYGHTFGPYHDGYGVVHPVFAAEVDASAICGVDQSLSPGTASDGSGYTLNPTGGPNVQVISRSGQIIHAGSAGVGFGSGTLIDANGNMISATNGTFTDTLGMNALVATGGAPNPLVFTYTDSSGTQRTVTVNYTTFTVKTNFGCSGISEYGPVSVSLITSIVYPDSSSVAVAYEPTPGFSGDVTGRVQSITLRTGATITYAYTGGNNGIMCADGSTAGLTRTTSDGTTTYTRSGSGSSWSTTVTDASTPGNQTVINFQTASGNFYETHRTVNQGASTVLLQTDTCYNGSAPPCSSTAITLPFTVIRRYLTLNNNQQSFTNVNLNSFGLPTEVDDYDFGNGSPGALLRTTLTTYASLGNNIVDHPASIVVQDGGAIQKAKTTFGYDETTPATTSGVPQHTAISGSRGNLTSVNSWLNTTNSNLTTTLTYDDTGNVLTSTDRGGHQTQLSYSDNFSDGVNRNALAYLTQVTMPDTNSPNLAHHVVKAQYDANTGLPVNTWDQNNQQTVTTYDAMLRPLQVNSPDGGNTSFTYWNPNQTDVQGKITSTTNTYSATLLDSYGRVSRVARQNGESNPWDQQDFCYDSNGRLSFQSYAYQGSGWSTPKVCSGAGDSFAYDALGRTTSVTHSDGNSVLATYTGRAVQVQDEGNGSGTRVTHVYQQDGLGRTVTSCELASSIFGIQTMPTCGLDLAGNSNGVTTSYSYDALGHVSQISQGALIARQMTYDSLGHLLSETIPEAGGTTTSYAYNSDGLLTSRTRPSANQAASCIALGNCTTSTTNYNYDELHRLRTVSYVDAASENTPNFFENYDSNYTGAPGYNVGRLAAADVTNKAFTVGYVAANFAYDAMGRVTVDSQNFYDNLSWRPYNVNYTYNFLGLPATSSNGQGVTFTYTYNQGARLTQMTSSLVDANHPGTLFSAAHYNAGGELLADTLGNGVNQTFNYDARWRLLSASATKNTSTLYSLGGPGTGNTMTYAPNSQLAAANDSVNSNWSYSYDALNRIAGANKSGATSFSFDIDRNANRWHQNPVGQGAQLTFDNTSNHITNGGVVYDAAGNIINDGIHTYTYDAEYRITQVDGGATATYFYDALGRRVRLTVSGSAYEDVYQGTKMVAESRTSDAGWMRGEVYAGSHLATYINSTTYFSHKDWEGSERVRSDVNGNSAGSCTSAAYGDSYSCAGTDPSPVKYAGMEYDSGTQLYHTLFRYYNPRLGMWMTPDPAGRAASSAGDPQSLNRYAYAGNIPINAVDPLGLRPVVYEPPPTPCAGSPCVINGNNIFDALSGAPGTYISIDMYGNVGFGFDIGLWSATQNYLDRTIAQLRAAGTVEFNEFPILMAVIQDFGTGPSFSGLVFDDLEATNEQAWLVSQLSPGDQKYLHGLAVNGISITPYLSVILLNYPGLLPYGQSLSLLINKANNEFMGAFGVRIKP